MSKFDKWMYRHMGVIIFSPLVLFVIVFLLCMALPAYGNMMFAAFLFCWGIVLFTLFIYLGDL